MELQTVKKPSKAETFELVLKIASGETPTPYEMSLLVNYFSPTLPAKAKTPFDYVVKAVECKGDRKVLNYIHVRGGTAYASDGKRMHYAPVDKQDGLYSAAGVPAVNVEAQRYGDSLEGLKPKTIGQWETAKLKDCEKFLVPERVWVVKVGKTTVDLQYLKPAINHQEDFRYQAVPQGILVECAMGMAVVAEYRVIK
jgi:hypothetical protein